MNSALLLANAIALATLLGFHFAPENGAEPVAQRMPHYLQIQKAPQWAVMSDQPGSMGQAQEHQPLTPRSAERLVF